MLKDEDLKFISHCLPFLKHIDKSDLDIVYSACSKSILQPGEIIMNEEKECRGIVAVNSGQLRAYFESEDGKEITLYRLLPNDVCILTASCVLKNITFEITLEVEKKSTVFSIPAKIWSTLSEKYSSVKEYSIALVNRRFSDVMWVMEQMVSKNMGQRVASFLLEQAELEHSRTISVTHEEISKNLGTAREVISRILKYFENDGLLKLSRGRITLTDIGRLKKLGR
jgi:CRP/FNR family transcriptional regulator